jgi:long-subunit fatty acid transport protein
MYRKIIAILTLLIVPTSSWAGMTTGARIMNYPVSARVLGMGEAFVGLADDVNAIHYNPAGLNLIPNQQIGITYLKGLYDTFYTHLGYALPIGQDAGAGLSLGYFDGGQMEITQTNGSSSMVKAQQDILVTLSGGMRVYGKNMMGINIKIFSSTLIEQYQAITFAFDAGVLYELERDITLGLTLKNVGPNVEYNQTGDPLPTTIITGIGYIHEFESTHRMNMVLDVRKPLDLDYQVHGGVEYVYDDMIFIRAGYKYGHDLDGATIGFGVEYEFLRFDYAIGLMSDLDLNHYISLGFNF